MFNLKKSKNFFSIYLTPFLNLYKSQYTSIFSILMRISGYWLLFIYVFLIFSNNSIFFTLNLYNLFYNFEIFNLSQNYSLIFFSLIFFFIILGFLYHSIFGIRYILSVNIWSNTIFNKFLNLKNFYLTGFFFLFILFCLLFFLLLFFNN